MKKHARFLVLIPVFVALAVFVWAVRAPVGVLARNAGQAAAGAAAERWNLGINVEGAPVYTAIVGRSVGSVGAFRSNRGVSEMTMIFPAPAAAKTVQSASFYLVSRGGGYTGTASLSLRIYDYTGTLVHTVSAADVDLQAAATGQWVQVTLKDTPEERVVSPGEFLAFHVAFSDGPGGDLDVRPMFDVSVQ